MSIKTIPLAIPHHRLVLADSAPELYEHLRSLTRQPEKLDALCRRQPHWPCLVVVSPGSMEGPDMGIVSHQAPEYGAWVAAIPDLLQKEPELERELSSAVSPFAWSQICRGRPHNAPVSVQDRVALQALLRSHEDAGRINLFLSWGQLEALCQEARLSAPHRSVYYRGPLDGEEDEAAYTLDVTRALAHLVERGELTDASEWSAFFNLSAFDDALALMTPIQARDFIDLLEEGLQHLSARQAFGVIRGTALLSRRIGTETHPNLSRMIRLHETTRPGIGVPFTLSEDDVVWSGWYSNWLRYQKPNVPISLDPFLIESANREALHSESITAWLRCRSKEQILSILEELDMGDRVLLNPIFSEPEWIEPIGWPKKLAVHYAKRAEGFRSRIHPGFLKALEDQEIFNACAPELACQRVNHLLMPMIYANHPRENILHLVKQSPHCWKEIAGTTLGQAAFELAIARAPEIYWDLLRQGVAPVPRFEAIAEGLSVTPAPGFCPDRPMPRRALKPAIDPAPASQAIEEFSI